MSAARVPQRPATRDARPLILAIGAWIVALVLLLLGLHAATTPRRVGPDALASVGPRWQSVALDGVKLEWPRRLYRVTLDDGTAHFSESSPRAPVELPMRELVTRREALVGSYVRVKGQAPNRWLEFGYDWQKPLLGGIEKCSLLVAGISEDWEIWLVTKPSPNAKVSSAQRDALLAQDRYEGRLERARDYAERLAPGLFALLRKEINAGMRWEAMNERSLVISPMPSVRSLEVWAPVAGSAGRLWVALEDAADLEGRTSFEGVTEPGVTIGHPRLGSMDALLREGARASRAGSLLAFAWTGVPGLILLGVGVVAVLKTR